jgi:two-component system, NtrC family, response regulator AtoC
MGTSGRPLSVLVVEDDPRLLDIITSHLDRTGYAVRSAPGAAAALERLGEGPCDVVVSDVRMAGMDGRALLSEVRERFPPCRVVLMTAFGSVGQAVEAMQSGAYFYVAKPFKMEVLFAILRNIAREVALGAEVAGLRRAVQEQWSSERLVGRSPAMEAVRQAIREAARIPSTVLVTGPSGTGKELCARAIHCEGPRAAGPFVPVNCAAIPDPLFESALFGHARGAFTGAVEDQPGFIERSSGGTLLLDEIGEIPLAHQAKLLRVLEDGELRPVGAPRSIRVDLRVVATTNRDLGAAVEDGSFRTDLFYRLAVVHIQMPPLSRRLEDLPALAGHLLADAAREHGVPSLGLTEEALEALARHPWPGNVRELKNVLERALLAVVGRRIDAADLRFAAEDAFGPGEARSLAEVEKEHVEQVLAACGWNRTAAARALGIDCRTLNGKIRLHGLVGPLRPGPRPRGPRQS